MWKGIWLLLKIFEDFRKEYNKLYTCLSRGKNMKDEIRLSLYSGSYLDTQNHSDLGLTPTS